MPRSSVFAHARMFLLLVCAILCIYVSTSPFAFADEVGRETEIGGTLPPVHELVTSRTIALPAVSLSNSSALTVTSGTVELVPSEAVDDEEGKKTLDSASSIRATFVVRGSVYAFDGETQSFSLVNATNAALTEDGHLEVPSGLMLDGITYPVSSIMAGAFRGSDAMLITLPSSIIFVDESAMDGAEKLQMLYVSNDSETYASYDGCLYDGLYESLLLIPEGKTGTVRIASGAKVEPEAFSHCASVDSVSVDADGAAVILADAEIHNAEHAPIEIRVDKDNGDADAVVGASDEDETIIDLKQVFGSIDDYVIALDADGREVMSSAAAQTVDANGGTLRVEVVPAISTGVYFEDSLQQARVMSPGATYQLPAVGACYSCDGRVDTWLSGDAARSLYLSLGGRDVWSGTPCVVVKVFAERDDAPFLAWGPSSGVCAEEDIVKMTGGHELDSSSWSGTFYAHWLSYITIDYNGGHLQDGQKNASTFSSAWNDMTIVDPVRDDGTWFLGWQVTNEVGSNVKLGGTFYDYTNRIYSTLKILRGSVGNVSIKAVWGSYLTINYDGGHLSQGESNGSTFGSSWDDKTLINPVRDDGTFFVGWQVVSKGSGIYLGGQDGAGGTSDVYNPLTIKSGSIGNISVKAIWGSYITIDYNGGHLREGETNGSTFSSAWNDMTINDPVRDDGTWFMGWQVTNELGDGIKLGGTINDYSHMIYNPLKILSGSVGNISIKAAWGSNLIINYDGGHLSQGEINYSSFGSPWDDVTLVDPVRDDDTFFVGWQVVSKGSGVYLGGQDGAGGTKGVYKPLTIKSGSIGSVSVKAIWGSNITIDYNGGHLREGETNGSTFSSAWNDMTINDPVRDDGTWFLGWQVINEIGDDTKLSGTFYDQTKNIYGDLSIGSGSIGNLSIKAVWRSYLILDYDGGHLLEGMTNPSTYATSSDAFQLVEPVRQGFIFVGWLVIEGPVMGSLLGEVVGSEIIDGDNDGLCYGDVYRSLTVPTNTCGHLRLRAVWSPALSVSVPIEVSAQVDIAGIEEQVDAIGYIRSLSGGKLEVARVDFESLENAADLFGSYAEEVLLEVFPRESPIVGCRFPLHRDAAISVTDGDSAVEVLAPFSLSGGYGSQVDIVYRLDIPDDVLGAIDLTRFNGKTTPIGRVRYTVAIANDD